MAKRVFVHIGAPKTGSTYVQNVLFDNAERLEKAGILIPATFAAHDQAMTDLRAVPWRDPQAYWTWDLLAEKAAAFGGDVILTSEGFGAASAEQAKRAVETLQPAEVHIVVAARDLWRTLPSMWQQSIRARSTWRFEDFLAAVEKGEFEQFWEHYTANRMFLRWADLVPPAQRHLVTVPPAGVSHDLLWQRFAGVLGIPGGVCEPAAPTSNPSLGAPEIEVLRRVNAALGDRYPHRMPYQRVVQQHLVRAVLQKRDNEVRFGVGLDRADWVMGLAEQQITELRDYDCHIVGDLGELRPAGMRQSHSPDELDDRQILDAAIETIIGMIGHAEDLQGLVPAGRPGMLARVRRGIRRTIG
ncbi:hypothetical protein [Actinoplanes derwentensis]|uniref:Sulfotransferase family protein n=1 Tax=Actinoplanes derwentensis TaxID=113562 RepID=A0A1H1WSX0_9ACTN|nr:hypothetical protein [Actinoplanes derwentensis]GID86996.1 hypothetical protein Ade03nite_59200 [Actinoplanes derwentensis]SDS99751.1 hypothetical protein SAMN04489716_2211 [Actinoplanes derwentensis]